MLSAAADSEVSKAPEDLPRGVMLAIGLTSSLHDTTCTDCVERHMVTHRQSLKKRIQRSRETADESDIV